MRRLAARDVTRLRELPLLPTFAQERERTRWQPSSLTSAERGRVRACSMPPRHPITSSSLSRHSNSCRSSCSRSCTGWGLSSSTTGRSAKSASLLRDPLVLQETCSRHPPSGAPGYPRRIGWVKTLPVTGRTPASGFSTTSPQPGTAICDRPRKTSASSPSAPGSGTRCLPAGAPWSAGTDRAGSWAIYASTIPRARRYANAVAADTSVRFPRDERSSPAREKRAPKL